MKSLLLLLLCIHSLSAFNIDTNSAEVANGKTLLVKLQGENGVHYDNIIFDKQKFQVFKNPVQSGSFYSLIPVSYYDQPAKKEAILLYSQNGQKKQKKIEMKIVDGNYKKEKIVVSNSKVNPTSAEVKRRISKEYNQAMKIYHKVTQKSYIHKKFILPLESNITSPFGTARVYNNRLKGYHSGTDFRAKMGTPIKAANDGRVVLVAKRFYSGGTVIINHGEGIYTCYFHMSKFSVKKGDMVKRGQLLGLSGKSGRVTGPHLHFSARVNAVQVDPLQLIALLNKNILKDR